MSSTKQTAGNDGDSEFLTLDNGLLSGSVRLCQSPNHNERPLGTEISLLVVHNISLPPGQFKTGYIEQFFCNALSSDDHPYFATISHLCVSAHCLIERDGSVIQFVSFLKRAWHAGQSSFNGRENCNDFSIGIELEGTDQLPYTDAQYTKLARIVRLIMQAYPAITSENIVGHEHIAPGRKTDPGSAFDWARLHQEIATTP